MIKVKLIEDHGYYRLRAKQTLLILLISIPFGILVNFMKMSTWGILIALVVYVVFLLWLVRNQQIMQSMKSDRFLEIAENEILIRSQKGATQERIQVGEVDKIIFPHKYSMPQDSLKDIKHEVMGSPHENFIIIQQDQQERRFDFEIESHYMVKQMEKVVDSWKQKGYRVATG